MTLLAVGSHGLSGPAVSRLVQADIDLTFLCECMCVRDSALDAALLYYISDPGPAPTLFQTVHFTHANGSFRELRR